MKSLFRSIRRKLLLRPGSGQVISSKLVRYLAYALGEILLIVVGILFALKINDWNEQQKARLVETKILEEIRSNLILDLEEIREDTTLYGVVQESCRQVIHLLETENVPSEAFQMLVGNLRITPHFDPNHSGYDLLKSRGVEIVLNDRLRRSISDLYESAYTNYYRYEEERTQFWTQTVNPTLLRYFFWSWDSEVEQNPDTLSYGIFFGIPEKDYTQLQTDPAFRRVIHGIVYEYSIIQNRAERTEGIIVELIEQLDDELSVSSAETR